jgi:hypothetical protein
MITSLEQVKKETIKHIIECSKKKVIAFNTTTDKLDTNYTINFFPDYEMRKRLGKIIAEFKSKYTELECMDTHNLHITILGLIPMTIPIQELVAFTKNHIPTDVEFKVEGMETSESVASFLAFSQNTSLSEIRKMFREEVSEETKRYSGRYGDMGWINIARFKTKPPQQFYDDIIQNVSIDLGTTKGNIKILRNSSRMLRGAEVIFEA